MDGVQAQGYVGKKKMDAALHSSARKPVQWREAVDFIMLRQMKIFEASFAGENVEDEKNKCGDKGMRSI